jgi:tRNA (guanine37-N1)-methyltransferase
MRIKVLTLFPGMFAPVMGESMMGRAVKKNLLSIQPIDIREYTKDKHRRTDDYPFGGGAGLVMTAQPIVDAMRDAERDFPARRIYLSPRGRTLTQERAQALSQEENLILLCGHYEGVDQRAIDLCIDEEISIGDYVLTGGELPAMVLIDCVARLIPGVLGSSESSVDESFSDGLLEYPQYTRPAVFEGMQVPEVLLSGHHANIVAWRREQALMITKRMRPDLLSLDKGD